MITPLSASTDLEQASTWSIFSKMQFLLVNHSVIHNRNKLSGYLIYDILKMSLSSLCTMAAESDLVKAWRQTGDENTCVRQYKSVFLGLYGWFNDKSNSLPGHMVNE